MEDPQPPIPEGKTEVKKEVVEATDQTQNRTEVTEHPRKGTKEEVKIDGEFLLNCNLLKIRMTFYCKES